MKFMLQKTMLSGPLSFLKFLTFTGKIFYMKILHYFGCFSEKIISLLQQENLFIYFNFLAFTVENLNLNRKTFTNNQRQ